MDANEPLEPRVSVPWPDPKRGPYSLTVNLAVVDGRIEVVRLEIDGRPSDQRPEDDVMRMIWGPAVQETAITSSTLRRVSLPEVIDKWGRRIARSLQSMIVRGQDPPLGSAEYVKAAKQPNGGRRPPADDHFREVARVYREALAARGQPTKEVAERLAVSRSTAAKHVMRARQMGLLPPTEPGRPKA